MKKNIVLLFTDQQRYDTLHNDMLQTPNLDALCKSGVTFTRAYTPSPVCVPARLSMNYGIYPATSGCADNGFCDMSGRKNLFEVLGENGYHTQGIGKMHFSSDKYGLHGFTKRDTQEEIFAPGDNDDYRKYLDDSGYTHIFDHHGQRSEMYYLPQIAQMPARHHPTQWVGDRSVEFIRNYREEKPFLLMSSFIHPHPPFCPPTPWNKLYRMVNMPSPFVPEHSEALLTYFNKKQNRYKGIDNGINGYTVRTLKAFYYACISFIDYQVGRIVAELKNRGIYEDTLILFASDHGELLGDYNCYGKRTMLDAACRIPLVVKGPGFTADSLCGKPASLVDLFPTILSFAGISPEGLGLEGKNLSRVADGAERREAVYSQYSDGDTALYMIATENEKYIRSQADTKDYYFVGTERESVNQFRNDNLNARILKRKLVENYLHIAEFPKTEPMEFSNDKSKGQAFQDHKGIRERECILPEGYHADLR